MLRQRCPGQGIDQLALRIEPKNLRYFRVVFQQMAGTQAKDPLFVGQGCHVYSQLLELLFIAVQVKAQVLLKPEDILDQAGALFVNFVEVEQPE